MGRPPLPVRGGGIKLIEITQFMWLNGDIPRELGWTILALIPKGNMDTRGIGLL